MPPISKRKKRRVKLEKHDRKSVLSQDGNKAQSYKSVASYVLGDLDLSRDEQGNSDTQEELGSFEISSASSPGLNLVGRNASTPRSGVESPTHLIKKPPATVMRSKQFSEDRKSVAPQQRN